MQILIRSVVIGVIPRLETRGAERREAAREIDCETIARG